MRAWTPYGFAVCKDGNRKQLSEHFPSKSGDKRFDYYGHDYYHHDKYYNCYYYYHYTVGPRTTLRMDQRSQSPLPSRTRDFIPTRSIDEQQ